MYLLRVWKKEDDLDDFEVHTFYDIKALFAEIDIAIEANQKFDVHECTCLWDRG